MRRARRSWGWVLGLVLLAGSVRAQGVAGKDGDLPTVASKVLGLEAHPGLLTFHSDPKRGKVWLEVPPAGERGVVGTYLYYEGILTGVGSNPIGLDRGQLGQGRIVSLRRVGARLLVEQQNLQFRALSPDARERAAVRESFATSVLWAGDIVALDPDGRALVDWTPFLLRDAHGVAATLRQTGQGAFALDAGRSAVDLESCLAFPENVELEALLTFTSSDPGPLVVATAPAPEAVSVVLHQSLIKLPDDGYQPRLFDPRAGSFSIRFHDYASPLDQPIDQRWIVRHRLQKVDPAAARSRVVKPIVFYIDSGAPELVRNALVEGASWWARAFEAAGLIDAYRVEVLPPGAHPLDARYNVVQWVHRSTRGWSYGGGIIDPRTGEMVKGQVTLGSLRVRQDRLIFEGLLGTDLTGSGRENDPVKLALWRIKQLAAHEVGHALGFSHNFAASTYAGRASVMDYPAPLVELKDDGSFDLSHAYTNGVGAWDVQSVRYAYSQFPPGTDEPKALAAIVEDGLRQGLLFMTDADARPLGSAHPLAHLWDNGADAAAGLEQTLRVRNAALERFGERNVRPGQPLARLEEVLATVYLYHRYQLEAAGKLVGGVDYRYAVRGDGQPAVHPVDGASQRRALAVILQAIQPSFLDLPENVLGVLPPRPSDFDRNLEMFTGATAPIFDALGAATTAADLAFDVLLDPSRAARLIDQHRRSVDLPDLSEVTASLVEAVFTPAAGETPRRAEIRRAVEAALVSKLGELAGANAPGVRARTEATLAALAKRLRAGGGGAEEKTTRDFLAGEIERYLNRPFVAGRVLPAPPPAPPGSPIGMASTEEEGCSFAGTSAGVIDPGATNP